MKTRLLLVLSFVAALSAPVGVFAQKKHDTPPAETPEPPVPVVEADPRPQPPALDPASSGQRLYAPATTLVSTEKAQQVVADFRATAAKDKPRYLIYVNRELVDELSGFRVTARTERVESVTGETKSDFTADPNAPKPAAPANGAPATDTQVNINIGNTTSGTSTASTPGKGSAEGKVTRITSENTYTHSPKTNGTLVDKQTVRDIERLFGRPLRAGGARLADQRTATSLLADKPLDHFTVALNEPARKDREALAAITDVVVEILVSSRTLKVAGLSGDTTYTVPDIQATAIRLSDSAIIGQASATDVLGKDKFAGRIARQFDTREIAEATALALMEDIALTSE
jgi:hypothetical protein